MKLFMEVFMKMAHTFFSLLIRTALEFSGRLFAILSLYQKPVFALLNNVFSTLHFDGDKAKGGIKYYKILLTVDTFSLFHLKPSDRIKDMIFFVKSIPESLIHILLRRSIVIVLDIYRMHFCHNYSSQSPQCLTDVARSTEPIINVRSRS